MKRLAIINQSECGFEVQYANRFVDVYAATVNGLLVTNSISPTLSTCVEKASSVSGEDVSYQNVQKALLKKPFYVVTCNLVTIRFSKEMVDLNTLLGL